MDGCDIFFDFLFFDFYLEFPIAWEKVLQKFWNDGWGVVVGNEIQLGTATH